MKDGISIELTKDDKNYLEFIPLPKLVPICTGMMSYYSSIAPEVERMLWRLVRQIAEGEMKGGDT